MELYSLFVPYSHKNVKQTGAPFKWERDIVINIRLTTVNLAKNNVWIQSHQC